MPKAIYLSSSSTLINLGCTGHPRRGLRTGKFYHYIGDSETGKTSFALSIFAEAAKNSKFDKYRLIFEDAEDGMEDMDLDNLFGSKIRKRIEPLIGTRKIPDHCDNLEEFYDAAEEVLKDGPCILILDSLDALESEQETEKRADDRKARDKGNKIGGTFGQSRPKTNNARLRLLKNACRKTKSILVLISQTRTAFGGFETKTYSGGLGLRFYAHVQIWTSLLKTLKKKVNQKDRPIGAITRVKFRKNRSSGWKGTVDIPYYWTYGFDDVGSMIDLLREEKVWPKTGGVIRPKGLKLKPGTKDEITKQIEDKDMERELQDLTQQVWKDVQRKTAVRRKPRYE